MTKQDRIMLAVIMGRQKHEWGWISCTQGGLHECKHCKRSYCSPPWTLPKLNETEIFCDGSKLLDPEVFADHDYVCLLWVQENWRGETQGILWKDRDKWVKFKLALMAGHLSWQDGAGYKKGDYARALLAAVSETEFDNLIDQKMDQQEIDQQDNGEAQAAALAEIDR